MNNGLNFFFAHTIINRATAMYFPLMHLSQCANHGKVHHRSCLRVDDIITPTKAPAPSGHRLLKGAGEVICRSEILFNVLGAQYLLSHLEAFLE